MGVLPCNVQDGMGLAVNPLRTPLLPEVRIELKGMIPPSVNHYVKHTRAGRHYKTKEANDFAFTLAVLSKGSVQAEAYRLEVFVYLGAKQKGDGDNFFKVVADALVTARVITSDAAITQWYLEKHRDRENPRTVIHVKPAQADH